MLRRDPKRWGGVSSVQVVCRRSTRRGGYSTGAVSSRAVSSQARGTHLMAAPFQSWDDGGAFKFPHEIEKSNLVYFTLPCLPSDGQIFFSLDSLNIVHEITYFPDTKIALEMVQTAPGMHYTRAK